MDALEIRAGGYHVAHCIGDAPILYIERTDDEDYDGPIIYAVSYNRDADEYRLTYTTRVRIPSGHRHDDHYVTGKSPTPMSTEQIVWLRDQARTDGWPLIVHDEEFR